MIDPTNFPDAYSRPVRPLLSGVLGAASTAHPLATAAAQEQLFNGGSAADAVVAAQAVLSVIAPESCGLGGDAFILVRDQAANVVSVNAAGASAKEFCGSLITSTGASVTVPGMVAGWEHLLKRWGRFPLSRVLLPAIRLAEKGFRVRPQLRRALEAQRDRLMAGGGEKWVLINALNDDNIGEQAELTATLKFIGSGGSASFYNGDISRDMCGAIQRHGGSMQPDDFASHRCASSAPITVQWNGYSFHFPPPMSQGVLMGMALCGIPDLSDCDESQRDHIAIELTEAAFAFRHRVSEGAQLLSEKLNFNPIRASNRGGPRAYLHTAGVAVSDASGLVISSLVSLFDDFGSAIYVPSGGFALNNRACGFTAFPNNIGPHKVPVHTLAPILVETDRSCTALATPGADGQVQTLLQIVLANSASKKPLDLAIHQPRWRSEDKRLIIEASHPALSRLIELGHNVVVVEDGDARLGSVVCAGISSNGTFAISDWRRESWTGVA